MSRLAAKSFSVPLIIAAIVACGVLLAFSVLIWVMMPSVLLSNNAATCLTLIAFDIQNHLLDGDCVFKNADVFLGSQEVVASRLQGSASVGIQQKLSVAHGTCKAPVTSQAHHFCLDFRSGDDAFRLLELVGVKVSFETCEKFLQIFKLCSFLVFDCGEVSLANLQSRHSVNACQIMKPLSSCRAMTGCK